MCSSDLFTAECRTGRPGYCLSHWLRHEGGADKYSSLSECADACDELDACGHYSWCPEGTEGCTGQWNKNGCWFFPEERCTDNDIRPNYAHGGYISYEKFSLKSLEEVSTGSHNFSPQSLVASFFMGMVAMGGVGTGIMRLRRRRSGMQVLSAEDAEDVEERLVE